MTSMRLVLVTVALLLLPTHAAAQAPMFPWWNSPLARNIGLDEQQARQVRPVVQEARGRLMDMRTDVERAESELSDQMSADPVDSRRASEAIEKVVSARAELTRALAQMSLRLRMVLTPEQWKQLQQARPGAGMRPGMRRSLRGMSPHGQ